MRTACAALYLWAICPINAQIIDSVVNAASMQPRLSPGGLAIVSGRSLPTSGSVTVDGKPAFVLSASPTQMSIQLPFDAATGATTVQIGAASFPVTLSAYAPAFFTNGPSGTVSGLHADGSMISNNNPVVPGESIVLYATGLGQTTPPLTAGDPGPVRPAGTIAQPTVNYASETATVVSSVMAPGQIGVYQISVRLTSAPTTGIRNIVLSIGGASSPVASLPIDMATAKPDVTRVISATGIPGSVQESIQSGSWVAIYGTNLAKITRDWSGEVTSARLPTILSGVSVSFNGKPAAVSFISPGQINVQAPDLPPGRVSVVVTNLGQSSEPITAQVQTHAPAFFQWGASKYAVTTRYPDNAYVGPASLGNAWSGAKAGDVLILWGTGFGPTNPPIAAGNPVPASVPVTTATLPTVTIGGVSAKVIGAALTPGLAGVYQVAVEVPSGLPMGDAVVTASIGGFPTPESVFTYISQ